MKPLVFIFILLVIGTFKTVTKIVTFFEGTNKADSVLTPSFADTKFTETDTILLEGLNSLPFRNINTNNIKPIPCYGDTIQSFRGLNGTDATMKFAHQLTKKIKKH